MMVFFAALLTDTKRIIGIAKEMTTWGVTKTIVVGEVPQVIVVGLLPNQIYYVDVSNVIPSLTTNETSLFAIPDTYKPSIHYIW